MFTVRSL